MTINEVTEVLTGVGLLLTGLTSAGSLIMAWHNGRKMTRVEIKQDQQHLATNSRLDQLISATQMAARAEGMAEGLQQGRSETKR